MLNIDTEWWRRNQEAIEARLAPVRQVADGVIYRGTRTRQRVVVLKDDGALFLYFLVGQEEVQSRMQLDAPLHLWSPYSQFAMLSLLWQPQPQRVFIIGLGGGRIPLYLHHVLSKAEILCAEIDADVIEAAGSFGFMPDARLKAQHEEGRALLAKQADGSLDILMMDAFEGLGGSPRALSTVEFYALCRQKLSPQGVMVVNMLPDDPLLEVKKRTLLSCFPEVYHAVEQERGNCVMLAMHSASGLSREDMQARARRISEDYAFTFPLREHAAVIEREQVLEMGPGLLHDPAPKQGRNDPCACGSGLKFKKCHGA